MTVELIFQLTLAALGLGGLVTLVVWKVKKWGKKPTGSWGTGGGSRNDDDKDRKVY